MSSDLKVTNIKHSSSGSNNLVLASDGTTTVSGALTASGGIANAGTITSGTLGSSVVFPAGGTGNAISVAIIADEKSYNTDGGGSSTGSFITRDLNTEISDPDNIVTIESTTHTVSGHTSTYKFTLGAGTYQISWSCPAFKSNRHTTHLYDETGTTVLQEGTSEYAAASGVVGNHSFGSFIHTISTNNTYQIRQRFDTAQATDGLGVAHDYSGSNNIYTIVYIYKLK